MKDPVLEHQRLDTEIMKLVHEIAYLEFKKTLLFSIRSLSRDFEQELREQGYFQNEQIEKYMMEQMNRKMMESAKSKREKTD